MTIDFTITTGIQWQNQPRSRQELWCSDLQDGILFEIWKWNVRLYVLKGTKNTSKVRFVILVLCGRGWLMWGLRKGHQFCTECAYNNFYTAYKQDFQIYESVLIKWRSKIHLKKNSGIFNLLYDELGKFWRIGKKISYCCIFAI